MFHCSIASLDIVSSQFWSGYFVDFSILRFICFSLLSGAFSFPCQKLVQRKKYLVLVLELFDSGHDKPI